MDLEHVLEEIQRKDDEDDRWQLNAGRDGGDPCKTFSFFFFFLKENV